MANFNSAKPAADTIANKPAASAAPASSAKPAGAAGAKQASPATAKPTLSQDIQAKWDKFSQIEITALKSDDELITQVAAKYGLEKSAATSDVNALLNGRHI